MEGHSEEAMGMSSIIITAAFDLRKRYTDQSMGQQEEGQMSCSTTRIETALVLVVCLGAFMFGAISAQAHPEDPTNKAPVPDHHQDLSKVAGKLNDPTSSIWALQVEFDLNISKGSVTDGDYKYGGTAEIQPVMPFLVTPKLGLITRPVIPIVFAAQIPVSDGAGGFDFHSQGGLGDISIPFLLNPKLDLGGFSFALGPDITIPTATDKAIGSGRWGMGPTALALWKNEKITTGALMEYYFDIGGKDSRAKAEKMTILYFAYYMFPGALQVGMNPVITYDNKATDGNKWNIPIGITVGKTIRVGHMPVKFQLGFDYSAKHQKKYGERFKLKFLITPVIKAPMMASKAWFGN